MPVSKSVVRVAVLAAALPLSGCAAMLGGYDLAPNGLTRDEDALRRDMAYEPEQAYASVIEGEREMPEDDLLRLLYAGMAGRYAGAYDESCHLLDLASYIAEDRVTTSISREMLSMVTSDRALAYVPGRTERLMIPYVAALNFLEAGDTDAAAVEARRIEALLDRLGETGNARGVSSDARFLHLFAASVFEAAGDHDAADVAYRRAGVDQRDGTGGIRAGTFAYAGDAPLAAVADPTPTDPEPLGVPAETEEMGEVVVLVERGFVPHRVEQSVVILLPGWQVSALTDGSAGEKALAATEAAARILLTASRFYGDRSGYYHDHGYRSGIRLDPWGCEYGCEPPEESESEYESESQSESKDESNPYLLRISWPVLYRDAGASGTLRVRAGELGVDAQAHFDVAEAVRRDFDERRAAIVARTIARAASKLALSASARSAVGKHDEAAGHVVGFLANIGTMLTERADTRSWHLLPGSVSMVRLRLPAGTHDLELELDGAGRSVSLGNVEVREGRTAVLTHRIWR